MPIATLTIEDLKEITITKWEYENLIRESERLSVIRKLLTKNGYVSIGDMKTILDVEESEE